MTQPTTLLDYFKRFFCDAEFQIYYNNGIGLAFQVRTQQQPFHSQILELVMRYMISEYLVCHDAEPQPFESGMIVCKRGAVDPLPNLLSLRIFKEGGRFVIAVLLTPVTAES